MKVGYARVSDDKQVEHLQRDALERAGCEKIFVEHQSGKSAKDRPRLQEALAYLRAEDQLVIWRLDRLGRSVSDLVQLLQQIESAGAQFWSLQENIDTTTLAGRLTFHIAGAFAEFERGLIIERTHAGLAAARARGRKGGRRPLDERVIRAIAEHHYAGYQTPVGDFCRKHRISRSTYYRYAHLVHDAPALHLQPVKESAP